MRRQSLKLKPEMGEARTLVGISIFWLALSVLTDAFATLVVPQRVALLVEPAVAATMIGLVTFGGLLAGMLVQPVAGAISDRLRPRWGRRGMLLVGCGLILLVLVAFAGLRSLAGVFVGFALLMVAASVAQAAQQGFIPDLVRRSWRGRAAGAKGLADVGGAFLGFLLLGALLAGTDAGPALLAVAAIVIVTAAATVILVREPRVDARASTQAPLVHAYRIDRRLHADFVRVVVARFLFLLGVFGVGRFLLLLIAERLGLDPSAATPAAGAVLAILALATALAAVPAGWAADLLGRGRVMLAGALLSIAGVALMIGAGSLEAILLSGGVMAVGSAAFSAANWALATDLAPAAEAARFLGLANFGTAGAAAAAGLLGAPADLLRALVPDVGYGAVLLVALVPLALSALAVRALMRRSMLALGGQAGEVSAP
jgi:MFS family permease